MVRQLGVKDSLRDHCFVSIFFQEKNSPCFYYKRFNNERLKNKPLILTKRSCKSSLFLYYTNCVNIHFEYTINEFI